MIKRGLLLSEQEVLYAPIEGKHCAIDDKRDYGMFYISMTQRMKHNREALNKFIKAYNEQLNTPSYNEYFKLS